MATCSSISTASKPAVSCPPSSFRVNLYAQELNNSAALLIEIGRFDRAIVSLQRALKLFKYQQKQHVEPCTSYAYTLEGCIVGTRELKRPSPQNNSIPCEDSSFISKQPILLPARGRSTMGPALLLIILHNLGLAHHLVAVDSEGSERTRNVRCAMAAYNLAWQTQTNLTEHQHVQRNQAETASIRSNHFKMIVLNNMSHLHKLNTDEMKHDHSLRSMLLPIIMLVVDQRGLTTNTTEKSSSRIELEGFLNNITPLILSPKYTADTA